MLDSGMMGWYRVIDDLWIPDPRDQRGAAWLYRAVMQHEYPSWNRVVDCIKGRAKHCAATLEASQCEYALGLASDLPKVSVASVSTVVTRMSETKQAQWTVRDSDMLVPSSSRTQALDGSSSARAWKDGSAHTAFVDL